MKPKGTHEGCIEQMRRLFADHLYTQAPKARDEKGRIRIDDLEMKPDVQAEVKRSQEAVTTENVESTFDIKNYREEFFKLFGFGIPGIDYEKETDIQVLIPSIPCRPSRRLARSLFKAEPPASRSMADGGFSLQERGGQAGRGGSTGETLTGLRSRADSSEPGERRPPSARSPPGTPPSEPPRPPFRLSWANRTPPTKSKHTTYSQSL